MESTLTTELSRNRLIALRVLFFLTFIGLAPNAWTELVTYEGPWDPFYGIAVSFWAALALMAAVGVFIPERLIPLLILQLLYKIAWLTFVGLPLYQQGLLTDSAFDLAVANGIGLILDALIIPWGYVLARSGIVRKRESGAVPVDP